MCEVYTMWSSSARLYQTTFMDQAIDFFLHRLPKTWFGEPIHKVPFPRAAITLGCKSLNELPTKCPPVVHTAPLMEAVDTFNKKVFSESH